MTGIAAKSDLEPPNGGFRAWKAVLGSFLLQTSSFGYVSACGVFQYYYHEVMLPHTSSQQLGWITTIAVFLIFGAGVPIGHLVDLYGTRPVIAPFAALGVLALGLLSLCKEYWQVMLCQGVLFGLACSGTTLPAVVCVTQWFSTKRGLAVGMASCGSSFGGLVFPIMVSRLLYSQGYAASVKWSTLVVGCGMALGVLFCESPFPSKRARAKAERSAVESEGSKSADVTEAEDVEKGGEPDQTQPISSKPSRFAALRHNGVAWAAFSAGAFFCTFPLLAPFNYLPEMAVKGGMDVNLAQYTVAVANGGSMVGRVLPGFMSDHMGQFNVMIMVSTASAVAMLAVWLPLNYHPSDAGIIFFAAFYGFVSGGYTSLLSPCVVSLVDGRVADLGLKFGIGCICIAIGALVGIPAVGAVRDNTGSFAGLIGLSGAFMAVGSSLFIIARVKKGGWGLLNKV